MTTVNVLTHWLTPEGKRVLAPTNFKSSIHWMNHVAEQMPKFNQVVEALAEDTTQILKALTYTKRVLNKQCKRIVQEVDISDARSVAVGQA